MLCMVDTECRDSNVKCMQGIGVKSVKAEQDVMLQMTRRVLNIVMLRLEASLELLRLS